MTMQTQHLNGVPLAVDDTTHELGVKDAAIAAELASLTGSDLRWTQVKIDQTAEAGVTPLKTALEKNYTRLHYLFVKMPVAGTITIQDSDGLALTGPIPVAAISGFFMDLTANKNAALIAAIGKGISINTSEKAFGFAKVSQHTA